jgi:hypothetical protein
MVTGKKSVTLVPGIAHVVAGMAWRVKAFQCPAVTDNSLSIADVYIWNKIPINPFL